MKEVLNRFKEVETGAKGFKLGFEEGRKETLKEVQGILINKVNEVGYMSLTSFDIIRIFTEFEEVEKK